MSENNQSKSIKDIAKAIQGSNSNSTLSNVENEIRKEKDNVQSNVTNQSISYRKTNKTLVDKILDFSKDDEKEKLLHFRVSIKNHKKIKLLNSCGLNTQAICSYLINNFLQSEKTKELINQIKNDVD